MRLGWAEPQEGAWSLPPMTMRGAVCPAASRPVVGRVSTQLALLTRLCSAFMWEALVDIYLPFLFVHTFWGFHLVRPALFIVYLRST